MMYTNWDDAEAMGFEAMLTSRGSTDPKTRAKCPFNLDCELEEAWVEGAVKAWNLLKSLNAIVKPWDGPKVFRR